MGLLHRRQSSMTCHKTAAQKDQTGGIARQETGESFPFRGLLLPPKKRVVRAENGVRLAMTWQVLVQGLQDIAEEDLVRQEGSARVFVVTACRRWPRHLSLDLERIG